MRRKKATEPIKAQSALIALLIFDLRAGANASVDPRAVNRERVRIVRGRRTRILHQRWLRQCDAGGDQASPLISF